MNDFFIRFLNFLGPFVTVRVVGVFGWKRRVIAHSVTPFENGTYLYHNQTDLNIPTPVLFIATRNYVYKQANEPIHPERTVVVRDGSVLHENAHADIPCHPPRATN